MCSEEDVFTLTIGLVFLLGWVCMDIAELAVLVVAVLTENLKVMKS